MSRLHGDPIEVWTREGQPAQFVWRDRLYLVSAVLDHWVVTREWWRTSEADPGERRFWRVETGSGPSGTYELRYDTASSGWLLLRAWD